MIDRPRPDHRPILRTLGLMSPTISDCDLTMFLAKIFIIFFTFTYIIINMGYARGDEVNSLEGEIYIDPDVGKVTVGVRPGVTWQTCLQHPSLCVGWPDSDSKLQRVPRSQAQEISAKDSVTGATRQKLYIEVDFEYTRNVQEADGRIRTISQSGRGWIETSTLRNERLKPLYTRESTSSKMPGSNLSAQNSARGTDREIRSPRVSCNQTNQQRSKNSELLEQISRKLELDELSKLDRSVELLRPLIGQCPLHPPNRKRADSWRGRNIYDSEVLPKFTRLNPTKIPRIPKETSPGQFTNATRDDLINIDTLARTIYAEMNECFKYGLQYPMAAARVAVNRAYLADQGRAPASYVGNARQVSTKPTLAKVLTAPWQFSVWNPSGAANPRDKTSLMALCPTRDNNRTNWKGSRPGPDDLYAWEKSLQIATEAVLFPAQFNRKTKNITQLYYTSKRTSFLNQAYRRPRHPPTIEGRQVDSFQCMYLWEKN